MPNYDASRSAAVIHVGHILYDTVSDHAESPRRLAMREAVRVEAVSEKLETITSEVIVRVTIRVNDC